MDDFSRFAPAYFDYMADCLDNEVCFLLLLLLERCLVRN